MVQDMEGLHNGLEPMEINFVERGEGIPVILIHGMAASLHDWQSLLPSLERAGYHCYALDLPGHGASAKPQDVRYYHTPAIYQQLEDWIYSLRLSEPAYLVSHSLGGYFSLEFAYRNPQLVRGMALISPLYTPDQLSSLLRHLNWRPDLSEKIWNRIPEWLINLWMLLDTTHTTRIPGEARQQIALDFKRSAPQIVHTVDMVLDLTPQLAEISAPGLVIWGKHDTTLNPTYYPRLVSSLPNAQGLSLPDCGHQPHIEQSQTVGLAVTKFFEQQNKLKLSTPLVEPPQASN